MRLLIGCSVLAFLLSASNAPAQKAAPPVKPALDADLTHAPESYRKRVVEFRNMIRREPTRAAKVRKATELARKVSSPYRKDSINFLVETRARESLPVLLDLTNDAEVREFAIYGLGELRSQNAGPTLIRFLSDGSDNVRGNAERALKKITRVSFSYRYSDPPATRQRGIREIQDWWQKNKEHFTVKEETPEERKEAEEAWDKYGKQYVQDLSR
ncbi:MAG: HEAT repeat domain-containing protein [Pseudomonadota bacterium]